MYVREKAIPTTASERMPSVPCAAATCHATAASAMPSTAKARQVIIVVA